MGYSPRGRKESDTTEQLHFHFLSRALLESKDLSMRFSLPLCVWAPGSAPAPCLGRGSALSRLGAELELRRSGSSLGPSQ